MKIIKGKNFGILFFISIWILSFSCDHRKSRPSPLSGDSIFLDQNKLTIIYSSPAVKNRKIWGDLVPYDTIWRSGANKATVLTTQNDILINDQLLPKGKYALFTVPTDSSWTIIFNKEWDQWGSYNYNRNEDQLRMEVDPFNTNFTENLSFRFDKNVLKFNWELLSFELTLSSTSIDSTTSKID